VRSEFAARPARRVRDEMAAPATPSVISRQPCEVVLGGRGGLLTLLIDIFFVSQARMSLEVTLRLACGVSCVSVPVPTAAGSSR
jgi:hypothetical protein